MWILSAVGSPALASTVCPRFHHMFALTHFPFRTSACSVQYIDLAPDEPNLQMILLTLSFPQIPIVSNSLTNL